MGGSVEVDSFGCGKYPHSTPGFRDWLQPREIKQ